MQLLFNSICYVFSPHKQTVSSFHETGPRRLLPCVEASFPLVILLLNFEPHDHL